MNHPAKSKINYTSLVIQIVGVLAIMNVIPPELEAHVTEITLILGPVLIQIFRTWFTGPKP